MAAAHGTADRVTAKPDLAATQAARFTPATQVVARVRDVLGPRLTASLAGVKDVRTVDAWTRTTDRIPELAVRRLQVALSLINLLAERYEDTSIAAWFTWIAEELDDHSPAGVLRKTTSDNVEEEGRRIIAAARQHLAG